MLPYFISFNKKVVVITSELLNNTVVCYVCAYNGTGVCLLCNFFFKPDPITPDHYFYKILEALQTRNKDNFNIVYPLYLPLMPRGVPPKTKII
jgi:uncharacterized Fe-S cluster-containing MiaB family protein